MKKFFFLFFAAACVNTAVKAQISLPKVDASKAVSALSNFVKPPSIGNISQTTGNIVSQLSSKLSLTAAQKPALTSAITSFLGDKSKILSLAGTDPKQYLAKLNPLQSGLFSKIKTVVGAAKFASFLKLKPTGSNVAGNVLSNLFF